MFAVIYRSYLKPGREQDYKAAWHAVAEHFIAQCGAQGSCLHKSADGLWVAYSRWPNKATRDAFWSHDATLNKALPLSITQSIETIKDCLDQSQKLPDIEMDVMDDQLLNKV